MDRIGSRFLLPTLLFVFTGLSSSLLLVSPATRSAGTLRPAAEASESQNPFLPWEPMLRPAAGVLEVQNLLAGLDRTNRNDRLAVLQSIRGDGARPEIQRGLASFAEGVLLLENQRGAEAVSLLTSEAIARTELAGYALLLAARELELGRPEEALQLLDRLERDHSDIALIDEARLLSARLRRRVGDQDGAAERLRLVASSSDPKLRGDALDELASLLMDARRYAEAVPVLESLYYHLPRHPRASEARRRLNLARAKLDPADPSRLYALGAARAKLLMEAERYGDARETLAALIAPGSRTASVADTERVHLDLGICHYRQRQFTKAVASLKKVQRDELVPEALYYLAEASRRLRQKSSYLTRASELLSRYPKSPWSEEMLLSLGRYHDDEDEHQVALGYYQRILTEFPAGKLVPQAKWRVLWETYRSGRYAEAGLGWEEAARERPGSDEVPKFLYWAGRAYQEADQFERAEPVYRQVLLGFQNTYYGRRALERLSEVKGRSPFAELEAARSGIDLSDAFRVDRVEIQARIAQLYAVGFEKEALREADAAVRGLRDDSAFLAMAAWIHADRRRNLDAFRTLRRAFPFHVSATGDLLPRAIWELFYPLDYWEYVESYSNQRGLDPYLVAALIRQESTFNPRVQSHAGARGLMQILPSTGRLLARQEKRRYNAKDLYDPEVNVRYGTRYLKDILGTFGNRVDYALASYNAGPHRVRRWTGMDLTIPSEIFIEEIPFNETRDYVKLVLRNEMLYRRLYGDAGAMAAAP